MKAGIPANTDRYAFHAADPGGFLIGRLDGEPVVCISVVRYGAGLRLPGFLHRAAAGARKGLRHPDLAAGMERLAGRNVGLDGVVGAAGQLSQVGFPPGLEQRTARRRRPKRCRPPASAWSMRAAAVLKLAAYDRRFFPEPRDSFLAPWITVPERTALVAMRTASSPASRVIRARRRRRRASGRSMPQSTAIAAALDLGLGGRHAATAGRGRHAGYQQDGHALAGGSG